MSVCCCGILSLDTSHLSCVVAILTCRDEISFVSICFSHAWRLRSSLLYMDWESLLPNALLLNSALFSLIHSHSLLCSSDLFLLLDDTLFFLIMFFFHFSFQFPFIIFFLHFPILFSPHLALGSLLASSCATGEFWCSYTSCNPTVHCCIAEQGFNEFNWKTASQARKIRRWVDEWMNVWMLYKDL